MSLTVRLSTVCLSVCVTLSHSLSISPAWPLHFVKVTAWWVSLDFPIAPLISVELTAPFLAAAAKAHIHSHTPHLSLTLFSVKDQHSHRYLTYHLLASSQCSAFFFFSVKHWLLISCVKAAGIPLPELKIRVPPSQPHVTEECEADLSPFFYSFTGFAIGLRLTLGQVKCTVTLVWECAHAVSGSTP